MTRHDKGLPVWFELITADRPATGRFYASVMGWNVVDDPDPTHGGYQVAMAPDGEATAGLMTPMPGMPLPPGWRVYFGTDDVDRDAGRIAELGGRVELGPMDIPDVGRFLVAVDPQGAGFILMRRTDGAAPTFDCGEQGRPGHGVWVELAAPDPDAAIDFYGALLGWSKQGAMPMGDMGEYAFVGWAEKDCPGAVMSSTLTGAPVRWTWYVQVPDIDAAVARATAGGGALVQGPDQIPGGSYSAALTDPEGNAFGLVGPRKEAA